ncbi:hypothetical protein X801_07551 [Opisthorchis viverrini]|uniref:Uncharacterized protein n=1 Tax=Opisthorchis viverrini TaxID=6198 RepID=A0A1S8WQC6_OPIVI|nr:hypothetical protein X801_07551 [Opisthorchis viverrini]
MPPRKPEESSFTAKSLLSADFPQPVLSSGAYTPNIVVKQGQLVSLLCIPPVPFATNAFWIGRRPPTRASGGRIQLDRLFGERNWLLYCIPIFPVHTSVIEI